MENQVFPGLKAMKKKRTGIHFVLCIQNSDCEDLELRKIYQVATACVEEEGFIRVIDESGEDYLYPEDCFVPIDVPAAAKRILAVAV